MAINDELKSAVDSILTTTWDVTDGQVVPSTSDIKLVGGARRLEATIFYADLADSTTLVSSNRQMAAKIFKCFLTCCTKLIRNNGGYIRSFDGDRVMGVFIGDNKNTSAGKCALQMKWVFDNIIKPKLEAQYEKLRDGTFTLGYCAGIDTGNVLVVRSGIRGNNDLLWVGRAANIAAKLSGMRNPPYVSYVTEQVYTKFNKTVKLGPDDQEMWEEADDWYGEEVVYRSNWHWKPE